MKGKKILSVVLALTMIASMFTVLTLTATVAATGEPTATATTSAAFIGATGSDARQLAAVMFPLTSKYSGEYKLQDKCQVEFTCKVKVLSGSKPVVGFLRHNTDSKSGSNNQTVKTTNWVDNTEKSSDSDKSYATFDAETGLLTVRFVLDDIPGDSNTYVSETRDGSYTVNRTAGSGGVWGALTIGNAAANHTWSRQPDFEGSYIISEPSMKAILNKDGGDVSNISGEMLKDFGVNNTVGVYGLAGRSIVGNGTDAMNHPMRAPGDKWSYFTQNPDFVKFVTVSDEYLTETREYTQVPETSNTREYYTNEDFGDVKFEKLGAGCYSVIDNDVNKKAVIIGFDGVNTQANIYLPLYTHRYFQVFGKNDGNYDWRDGYTDSFKGGNIFYHVSFNAKRLSGNGQPILGRLYAGDWLWNTAQFTASANAAYNNDDRTDKPTDENSIVGSTYDPETGAFTAVVRFNKGYMYQMSQSGYNEILTIGNAENSGSSGEYDSHSFGSSFAITDISIQVYDTDNTTLLDSEAAPQMTVGNYWFDPSTETIDDHTSQHFFESESTKTHNGRPTGLWNMPVDTWGVDGSQALISVVNRSDCLAACHTLTHHAADTENGTREYWSCDICEKNYADEYGSEEIEDLTAANKKIVVKTGISSPANVVLPIAFKSSEGVHYYKFVCDMNITKGDAAPTISLIQGSWWGGNGAQAAGDWSNNDATPDANGLYAKYDAENGKFEAVIKIDHSCTTLGYRNALTGAYAGILLGNGRHIGANGYDLTKYDTEFEFTNPEIYELTDSLDPSSVTGENLCPPITDKTLNFDKEYVSVVDTKTVEEKLQGYYGTEWTMNHTNNPLSAPVGMWSIEGEKSLITAECNHVEQTVEAEASTCATPGHGEYVVCSICGEVLSGDDTPLPLDPENHEGLSEDWESDANGHWHTCAACGQKADEGVHDYRWQVVTAATDDADGLKEEVCSVCGYKSGETEVIPKNDNHVPGDINGDVEVDNKDLIRLFQYLSEWGVEVNEAALDVNGDQAVDNKDLIRLFQYLSEWNVEIF